MDFKFCPVLNCSPEEAGFDGAKGIGLNHPDITGGGIFRLRRGSTDPRQDHGNDYSNQLVWFMPPDQPAQLLWCNSNGEWFNCIFQREDPAPTAMSKYTKLQLMLGGALNKRADDPQVGEVIEAMAEWFDILLEDMGIEPASIPSLLRWQYLHSDYASKLSLGIENDD